MGKLVRKMTIPYYIMQLENGDVNPSFVITIKKKKNKSPQRTDDNFLLNSAVF